MINTTVKKISVILLGFAIGYSATAIAQTLPNSGKTSLTPPRGARPAMQSTEKNFSPIVEQAKQHQEGYFSEMVRSSFSGGQIQEAWNNASPRDGSQIFRKCFDCVYRIRTREFMTTTVILPNYVEIKSADLGDSAGFKIEVRSNNLIAIRPTTFGIDTNLNIYTKSGEVYSFYIRAESHNSNNVPDLIVRILSTGANETGGYFTWEEDNKENEEIVKSLDIADLKPPEGENFVKNIPFNPADLHGFNDYKLWGDKELKPEMVFRDKHFTYLQFGKKWDNVELPTAYVVIDGFDELVNTRVDGTTFIIESVNPLISLKSGNKFLCVEYKGKS